MDHLERYFDTAFSSAHGIKKLREVILILAMQGKIVSQDHRDPPAIQLLKTISAAKNQMLKEGKIKKSQPLMEIKPEEVPYQLPSGWVWVRLGDISEYIQRGKGPVYSDVQEIPVISQKCIQWSGFDKSVIRFIDPKSLEKYQDERFIRAGDLLWNSTGTGTIGRINIYKDELNEFSKVVSDSHVTVVRLINICNDFVLNYLMSPVIQNRIEENASGTTNQIELNTSTIINQLVPLPPLSEQHRIVDKINQLMSRCDNLVKLRTDQVGKLHSINSAALQQLLNVPRLKFKNTLQFISQHFNKLYGIRSNVHELRKAILQLAVMGNLTSSAPNDPPASELLKEIRLEKQQLVKKGQLRSLKPSTPIETNGMHFALPKGWQWTNLEDVSIKIHYGYTASANHNLHDIKLLRITDIQDNKVDWRSVPGCDTSIDKVKQYILTDNDILIARTGGTIGKSYLVEDISVDAVFASYLIRIVPSRNVIPKYIKYFLEGPLYWKQLYAASSGTGQPNVNGISLSKLQLPLPPLAQQQRIVNKVDQLMSLCDSLDLQIEAVTVKQTELLDAFMSHV